MTAETGTETEGVFAGANFENRSQLRLFAAMEASASSSTAPSTESITAEQLAARRQEEQKQLKEKLHEEDTAREQKLKTDMIGLFDNLGAYLKGELLGTRSFLFRLIDGTRKCVILLFSSSNG